MCGIFGVVGRREHAGLREAALTLRHRGPDGFGDWTSALQPVYLAHCRLAIIDLSEAGRQPMANADGSIQLTFNGEIYNFKELRAELESAGYHFKSRTDSEVLVHGFQAWGEGLVPRLRGIFAFAIWDERSRRLVLARDRFGVKPLYFATGDGEIAFASESRALLAAAPRLRKPAPAAIAQFLRQGFVSGSQSIWEGVSRLPPATILSFDAASATLRLTRYWSPPDVVGGRDLRLVTQDLEDLLDDAVREELVADVPVGCFLSGGLDSSLVTSFAAAHSPRIRTYFADFPGWEGSERAHAQQVADYLATIHHVDEISGIGPPQDMLGASDVFDAFDEPNGDLAVIPTWHLSKAISRHVKVALSGDGGDELFAGYRRYQMLQAPSLRRRLAWAVERARRRLGLGRDWPHGCGSAQEYFQFLMRPGFPTTELRRLFPAWSSVMAATGVEQTGASVVANRTTRDWQIHDIANNLVDNNLARADRASMAHGLEIRVPLLDHRLAELALSLPPELNPATGGGKMLLRRIAERRLPDDVLAKPKQGFSFPLGNYVSGLDMAQAIRGGALVRNAVVDGRAFEDWIGPTIADGHLYKVWLMFVLEQWACRWWMHGGHGR